MNKSIELPPELQVDQLAGTRIVRIPSSGEWGMVNPRTNNVVTCRELHQALEAAVAYWIECCKRDNRSTQAHAPNVPLSVLRSSLQ